jgi:integrase
VPEIIWLKAPKPEFDFLSFEEAERLLVAADPQWYTMILIALRTGLRQGELIGLRWEDVDLVAGRLLVRQSIVRGNVGTPKSGKPREIPLSEQARTALKRYRHLKGELVFSDQDGNPLNKGECKWPLWRTCKKAGLRRIGWHVLRHTFASHLTMRGVPLKAVQELLGHATIEMTMRYAHLSPSVRRDAVQALDAPKSDAAPPNSRQTSADRSTNAP